jgi:sarcosine oxidase
MMFDSAIIGKGLVGSAAAKYLSLAGQRIVIIGPDEPTDSATAIVFASHYDSGRVQRLIGTDTASTLLNLQAARHYAWLEEASGIRFHTGVGCLYVNPRGGDAYLTDAPNKSAQHGVNAHLHESASSLAQTFPDFRFPDASQGMFEPAPAGHINPRLLIEAQLKVAAANKGLIVRETVGEVAYGPGKVSIRTHDSNLFEAKKVLLASGAFTNVTNLSHRRPALILKSETIILARIGDSEAQRLKDMPSLLYEVNVPEMEGIYCIGPVRYPDGDDYIKMGCNLPQDIYFENLKDIQDWFRSGASDTHIPVMLAALKALMPSVTIEDCISKRCILTRTRKHGNPYVL